MVQMGSAEGSQQVEIFIATPLLLAEFAFLVAENLRSDRIKDSVVVATYVFSRLRAQFKALKSV